MNFNPDEVYHIFNRGNNFNKTFFNDDNYTFFLKKLRKEIKPLADILTWSLMPNHYHLMINANKDGCKLRPAFGGKQIQELSFRFGVLQSSYSQAVNKQQRSRGSLFQQKIKSKSLFIQPKPGSTHRGKPTENYMINCMHYIHQNALNAQLVERIEDWPYSSFLDYCGSRNGTLCNKQLLVDYTGIDLTNFYRDSYGYVSDYGNFI